MIFIDRSQWLKDTFAEVLGQQDIIRQPLENYPTMSDKEKDQLRQTQVFPGEVVQVLGAHENFTLIRKFEQTLGWVPSESLKKNHHQKELSPAGVCRCSAADFLSSWKGIRYEFGGLSREGIDCSGFTQLYFLNVHNQILPKHSQDQRKIGVTVSFNELKDSDLIFCRPFKNLDFKHVALFFNDQIWHSRRTGGVICQTREEFLKEYQVEEIKRAYES